MKRRAPAAVVKIEGEDEGEEEEMDVHVVHL